MPSETERLREALRLSALRLHTICRAIELGFGAHVERLYECKVPQCQEACAVLPKAWKEDHDA